MKKKAFTLAEILIALVIIGVISAITVPVLMQNTQKQEFVSSLKKAYSVLSQAANMIIAEEGSPKGDDSWLTDEDSVYKMFKKYLYNAKDCGTASGCFGQGEYKRLNLTDVGKDRWDTSDWGRRLVLADGSQIMFSADGNKCSWNNHDTNGSNDVCAIIWIDLNGARKPNMVGRDLFTFVLKENGLYPAGCDIDGYCTKTSRGYGCACKVLKEGAMNY